MNEVKIFENEELGLQARTILNSDGSISVNAEDTATGFGWIKNETKNGKTYTSIRWERMNGFSAECGFAHEWSKDDYLPESLFYMLGFKAGNERALKYQQWLAIDVLPSLRKTGAYQIKKLTQEEIMRIQLGMLDEQGERLEGVEQRVDNLENTMNIDYAQQRQLKNFANEVVVNALGGKDARAYRYRDDDGSKISARCFSRFWHDFNDYFRINAYANLPRVRFEEALEYINRWQPPTNMQLEIGRINRMEDLKSEN